MRDQAPLQFYSFSVQAAAANNEKLENSSQLIRCCLPYVRMTSYSACRPCHVDTILVGFGDLAWGRGEGRGIESRNSLPMAFNTACLPVINCDLSAGYQFIQPIQTVSEAIGIECFYHH